MDRTAGSAEALGDAELAGRVGRLQQLMDEHGFAALICYGAHRDWVPADLWYLARWSCIDEEMSYVVVFTSGPTILVTDAEWDLDRAREEAYAGDVLFDREPGPLLAQTVRSRVEGGGRIGISGLPFFPAPVYLALASQLPGFELTDATWLTSLQRTIKSAAELSLMREAARVSDLGMAAGLAAAREGATEMRVAASAENAMRTEGAEISFTTVAGSGERTALTTFLPSDRVIGRGDLVVLDCGARVSGYHGDMCRSIVVGPPSTKQRRLLEAARDAVLAATEAAGPGVKIAEVHAAARTAVEVAGLGEHFWGYYMPHGIGAGQHEMPLGLDDADLVMQEGMVVCVEPGVAVPSVGGVVLEQMIAITPEGAETLNGLPLELWD
ncbi:MAG: M24 family metallopeptidase [Actinomycetota bacterium]